MAIRSLRSLVEGQTPITVAKTVTVVEAARTMKQHNIGALLVVDGSSFAASSPSATRCSACSRRAAIRRPRDSNDVMTRQPQTIHPDKPFLHALRIMHKGRFRHLPVVEDGRPLGMVSSRDALDEDLYELRTDLAQREDMLE